MKTCGDCKHYWEGREKYRLETAHTIVYRGASHVRNNKCFRGEKGMEKDTPADSCFGFEEMAPEEENRKALVDVLQKIEDKCRWAKIQIKVHNNFKALDEFYTWMDEFCEMEK